VCACVRVCACACLLGPRALFARVPGRQGQAGKVAFGISPCAHTTRGIRKVLASCLLGPRALFARVPGRQRGKVALASPPCAHTTRGIREVHTQPEGSAKCLHRACVRVCVLVRSARAVCTRSWAATWKDRIWHLPLCTHNPRDPQSACIVLVLLTRIILRAFHGCFSDFGPVNSCGMRKIGRRLDVRATPKIWFGTCESARNVVLRAVQGMFLHACFVCVCMVEAIFGCADRPGCIFSACPRLCLSGVAAARSVGAGNPFDARLRVRASFGQRSVLGGRCSRARRSLRFQGIDATLVLCTPSRFLRVWCTPCR